MKNLNVAFLLFCGMCTFVLNGCINGGSSKGTAPTEPAAAKAADTAATPAGTSTDTTTSANNNNAASTTDISLKPRDTPPTNLQKITLKNGLIVNKPIFATPNDKTNIYNKAVVSNIEKVVPNGKPYFRALVRPNTKNGRRIRSLVKNNGVVGLPYDSFTKSIVPGQASCLSDPISMDVMNKYSKTSFQEFDSQDSLSNATDGSLGIEASLGPVASVSATGSFVSNFQADSRSTYIYYIFRHGATAETVGVVYRPENPQSGLKMNYYASPTAFRAACGDGYVNSAIAGALIIVKLRFDFDSSLAKDEFNLAVSAQVAKGLADVTAKITEAMKQTNQKATLTIEAMQQGGRPQELPRVLGVPSQDIPKDDTIGVAGMQCATGINIEACTTTVSNIANYAQTLDAQMTGPKSYFYDSLKPKLYLNGVGLDMASGDKRLENRLNVLSSKYELANQYMKYLSDFNSRYSYDIRSDLVGQLMVIYNKLQNQIDNVFFSESLLKECYSGYPTNQCSNEITSAISKLNNDDMKLQPEEVQLLTHFLPHQQFRVGGIGLWRGDVLKRGVCNLVPVTTAQNTDVWLHLDCGLGIKNPRVDILASSISENQIIIDDFSYQIGEPAVLVACKASDNSSRLVFDVDDAGDTFTARGVKCFVDGKEYTDPIEKDLVLQRVRY